MSNASKIEWTDASWNCISGCTRASAGCDHCYAVKQTYRLEKMGQHAKYGGLTVLNPKGERHFNGVVRCHESASTIPLRWKEPRRIFVNSMADLFHKDVPREFIVKVRAIMALSPHHTFQTLTKRPERMAELDNDPRFPFAIYRQVSRWLDHEDGDPLGNGKLWDAAHTLAEFRGEGEQWTWPLPNEWKGTSCENQQTADERIPHLLKCPAKIRFLSVEPLLGEVRFDPIHVPPFCGCAKGFHADRIDWVIVGGESGAKARPCNVEWIRSIVRQCKAAGVSCFVKQLGANPIEIDEERASHVNMDGDPADIAAWMKSCEKSLDLNDPKGGNPDEWPADLRIREMPAIGGGK